MKPFNLKEDNRLLNPYPQNNGDECPTHNYNKAILNLYTFKDFEVDPIT